MGQISFKLTPLREHIHCVNLYDLVFFLFCFMYYVQLILGTYRMTAEIDSIKDVLEILDKLLSPEGCAWDRAQTLQSMRGSLIEEVHEVIDAINEKNSVGITEELGDLLFNVLFLCRLAEKESCTTLYHIAKGLSEKLIRRHPHVFGEAKVSGVASILEQWETIKSTEKQNEPKKNIFEGIPKGLPALAKAQKMIKKLRKEGINANTCFQETQNAEIQLGQALFKMASDGLEQGIDAEQALLAALNNIPVRYSK